MAQFRVVHYVINVCAVSNAAENAPIKSLIDIYKNRVLKIDLIDVVIVYSFQTSVDLFPTSVRPLFVSH